MKPIVLALLSIGMAFAGEKNYKVDYVGGSLSSLKSGSGMKLYIVSDAVQLRKGGNIVASIPTSKLDISFAAEVKPMSRGKAAGFVGMSVLTLGTSAAIQSATQSLVTRRLSFVWIESGKRAIVELEAHGDLNQLIANLEAATGKQIFH